MPIRKPNILLAAPLVLWLAPLAADPLSAHSVETILIKGRQLDLLGQSISASEGIVGSAEIAARPLSRTGEILEFIPGMIVTQHSGSGKSNQYFLRGFNLDHGTDFANYVDGMPVNMRSHGHGQGYTDLNFIIPELVSQIDYQKGSYHANSGDFAAAGSARFGLQNTTANELALTLGDHQYQRLLAKGTVNTTSGALILATELHGYDGPWRDLKEDQQKINLLGRYTQQIGLAQFAVTVMAYDNSWRSADQVPLRAIESQLIDRFGSLDTQLGGESSRYSISASWFSDAWRGNAYLVRSELALWSNFTYFLNDPLNGDQFEQSDQRHLYGGELSYHWHQQLADLEVEHLLGVQSRIDDIDELGLYATLNRTRLSTVRTDQIMQRSVAIFQQSSIALSESLTAHLGLRYDWMTARVDSDMPVNSGRSSDGVLSLKAGLNYQLSENWLSYLNIGQGFHSNDARGTTTRREPSSNALIDPVDFLVASEGAEIGLRYFDYSALSYSVALWYLEMDSELLYVGDEGTNEPSRASRRYGIEASLYYWLSQKWSLDTELAMTRSRFTTDEEGEGNYIDGALPLVLSMGATYQANSNWQLSLRLRHFGKRTLDSFNEMRSASSTVVNGRVQYQLDRWQFSAELFNLLNSRASDIEYFYSSRLPGETAEGIADKHLHPMTPRSLRLSLSYRF